MANNNQLMVDVPFFELMNQSITATAATAAMATREDGTDRFIYYVSGGLLYRYDTYADTWMQLATPITAPVTFVSLQYTAMRGTHGRVLSATGSSVTIGGFRGKTLDGAVLDIRTGTGAGQFATLNFVSETLWDAGVVTAVSGTSLTDSTKKWQVNQWSGYTLGITFGTDVTQYKRILYNDGTNLIVSDVNLQPHDPWNNQPYTNSLPYVLPAITAGSQTHYSIFSSTFNLTNSSNTGAPTTWTTTPDYTSFFSTRTGGLYLISSAAAAPFFTLQYYDIASDSWQTKTVPQSLIGAALGTDVGTQLIEKIGTAAIAAPVGTVSGASRTLTDSGLALTPDQYRNHRIFITAGTGAGQNRRIVAHTATAFSVSRAWDINPDSTSVYQVWLESDRLYINGGAAAAMYSYSAESDWFAQGDPFDWGIVSNISVTLNGWQQVGVTSGTRIALGIQTVASAPTAGGTGYVIGDVLTCSVGGAGAQVIVTGIASGGVVTSLVLYNAGTTTGYATGAGQATTGGTGTLCTINITAVGPTANIATASAHFFARGNSVTFAGCTDATWNAAYTITGVFSTTGFSVTTTAAATMAATASQSVTTIVDPTANWVVNEHVGRLVHLCVSGTAPTSQIRWIVSNTATVLTVATIVAGVNGTSKYAIYDAKVYGCDDQRRETGMTGYGHASSGSTTTLVDASKNWVPGQWVGYVFKVEAGTGYGSGRISITANSATTLTYTTQSFTPDATTRYEIADTWGLITTGGTTTPVTEATTKNWVTNFWAGKRFRITGGTAPAQETAVTSNTATALTSGALTLTDATSTYAILSVPPRGAGIELIWPFASTDTTKKKSLFSPRGGGSGTIDFYDLSLSKWVFGINISPQTEGFNTGSSYCYDGADSIYCSRSVAAGPIRVLQYSLTANKFYGKMTTTFLQGTVHIGNFMEIVNSPLNGYPYVYCLQNTGTLLSRALIF